MIESRPMRSLALLASGLLTSCIAHAPETVSGPETVVVAVGDLPEWPVNIVEDAWGIPHIRARSMHDAAFALGVLHAEERLWQLELNRRVGSGTLSEILGKRTLTTDKFLRTVGFRRAAESALEALGDHERRVLDAYAAGINTTVASLEELPPEFKLLRFEPAPWGPVDSLVVTKSMAWLLSGSAAEDALYWRALQELGEEQAGWLVPAYPDEGPRVLPGDQLRELRGDAPPPSAPGPEDEPDDEPTTPLDGVEPGLREGLFAPPLELDAWLGKGEDVGSNAWVVHGSRTDTGAPILANDPHLGVSVPAIWYLAEVDAPDLHVIGPTLVGLPGFPIGHNDHIAWGLTNVGADVMDLYREQPDPHDPSRVRRPEGWETLTEVTETIVVKGRSKPLELTVRISSNGPLVTEFYRGDFDPAEEVALRWTALDPHDRTVEAFFGVMTASNFDEFRAALVPFVAPSQNFVYADRDGHIGWQVPGRIPLRDPGFDGQRAGRGWVAQDAWQGWIPYDELPRAHDPLQGWIVTANNKPIPDDYRHSLGRAFTAPHRAMRIIDLLEQGEGRDVAGHRSMQLDVVAGPQLRELGPAILAVVPASRLESHAQDLVRDWDGSHDLESGAAAVFNAWMFEVADAVLAAVADGDLAGRVYGMNPLFLRQLFDGRAAPLCVTKTTADCDALAAQSLTRAVKRLKKELGGDATQWRWGDLHTIRYHHPLAFLPSLKKALDTELPSPGGPSTVNVAPYPMASPFTQTWHPSYRQVIDLSDWSRSFWMGSLGQSGVPYREHYRDMAEPYVAGTMLPMLFGREDVDRHAVRTRQIRR